jgi:hypothetical protein
VLVKEIFAPGIVGGPNGIGLRCVISAAIVFENFIEPGHESGERRGISDGVKRREPGHALFACAGFFALAAKVQDRHAQVCVAFHRDEHGVSGPFC